MWCNGLRKPPTAGHTKTIKRRHGSGMQEQIDRTGQKWKHKLKQYQDAA